MSGLLERAATWLGNTLRTHVAPARLAYRRGATEVFLNAAAGQTPVQQETNRGEILQWTARDYLIHVADLGALAPPQPGDRIAETIAGVDGVFEVLPAGDNACWDWTDPTRTRYRIHTKQVS